MRHATLFTLMLSGLLAPTWLSATEKPIPHESTHKQVERITPHRNGQAVQLNTFALSADGRLLTCVNELVLSHQESTGHWLQVYSPDGKLIQETNLPFNATAINEAPSGIVFVAGNGQVAKIDAQGKLLATADAPHLGDKEALRKQVENDAKEQMEQVTEMYRSQLERIEQMIAKIKAKEELTERDKKRLESFESQREMFAKQQEMMKESYSQFYSVDAMMASAMGITSLAVNENYVFLCCRTGRGYDVWRTDHEFSSPKKVVTGLSGCCGQCDIQADDENLILAENTKFKVSLLDLEGERLTSFGSRDKTAEDGFGSCCNPMNVRCCSNGDILTAESSIGTIKRFNKEGDYLGTIGKARIGGGCKHVAIGFDEKRNRYYMQHQDKNQICVMWPRSEAPEFTADELAAKEAMEGLGQKLLGDGKTKSGFWARSGQKVAADSDNGTLAGLGTVLSIAAGTEQEAVEETSQETVTQVVMDGSVQQFHFHANGKLEMQGGYTIGSDNAWSAVSQDETTNTLTIVQLADGVEYYNYRIQFVDEDTANITMMYGEQEMQSHVYHRAALPKK